MAKKFEHNRARTEILHFVLSFCMTYEWEPEKQYGRRSASIHGFAPSGYDSSHPVQPGDLVILQSAPATKWTIGWLKKIDEADHRRYLIESLEDGELCWWGNVGIMFLPRNLISPRWRWTDKQFKFQKKWHRAYHKHGDDKPNQCVFHEDGSATIGTRGYWDFALDGDTRPPPIERRLPDWQKTTVPMLVEHIKSMEAERAARRIAKKAG